MTEQPGDPRLEGELREVLRRRDPGISPSVLRNWVQGIPEEAEAKKPLRLGRPFVAALGLAAVVLLAVIGLTTLRYIGPAGVTGASLPGQTASSQPPAGSPAEAFDPTLEGAGVSGTDDFSPAVLVVLVCAVLLVITISVGGWRRVLSIAVGVLLAGWAIVGSFVPATIGINGYGPGLNVIRASPVPGSQEVLFYELAPASGRFSIGVLFWSSGPLPVRIEGVVSPSFGRDPRSFAPSMMLTALWIDRESNGGMTGPIRPFRPFDMPASGQSIWLVGRAGACALGSAFDPSQPSIADGFQAIESLDVRVSVAGWPRTVHLPLPFRLVEPDPGSCSGPTSGPSGAASRKPASP